MSNKNPLKGGIVTLFIIGLLSLSGMANAETAGTEFQASGYALAQDLSLHPVQVNHGDDAVADGTTLTLPQGTELAVLETTPNGSLVRLGVDSEEGSGIPTDFWVRAEEIPLGALIPFAPSEEDDVDAIELFGVRGKKGMTYCYRYVKQYLLQQRLVPIYLPGGSAWQAAGILPKYGFRRLGVGPSGTRHNDVCVYRGGRGGNGHIEVNRHGSWWYGYGFKNHPITPVNHRLIGCYRKG